MPHWTQEFADYLDQHHHEHPGVTEQVLRRSLAGHHTPYSWLARAVSSRALTVLDIGCGSGAMSRDLARPGRVVIGLDLSTNELLQAARRGPGPWVRGDARRLPLADESVDAVVSTLGLAVIHPLEAWLDEVRRVLKPGGLLAALTPTFGPLSPSDTRVAVQLLRTLRMKPVFPVGIELASRQVLAESGLRKIEDNRERYRFVVRSRADAELLLSALYLPGIEPRRLDKAAGWLARRVSADGEVPVPIPMRRLVAMKPVT